MKGNSEDELDLFRFCLFLVAVMTKSCNVVKSTLFAIKQAHLAVGAPDPLVGKPRIFAAIEGLKRWSGVKVRKFPVSPQMLKWLRTHLEMREFGPRNLAVLWAAFTTGWFFLLRVSEYLARNEWDERTLRGIDIDFRQDNVSVDPWNAEEVVVMLKQTKTDQLGFGTVRNHFLTNDVLCPVKALAEVFRQFPERWRGSESSLPLFRMEGGEPIQRSDIQQLLRNAAIATGLDPDRIGTHSLRSGGATAMYHVCPDVQKLRRYGRWNSDSFHLYLWESHEQARGLAQQMAQDDSTLRAPM